MRIMTFFPEFNKLDIYVSDRTIEERLTFDLKPYEDNELYGVYEIIGNTSQIENKELVYIVKKGWEDTNYKGEYGKKYYEFEEAVGMEHMYKYNSSHLRDSTHIYPAIELLTKDEYSRNTYRLRNFKVEYNSGIWKVIASGNTIGRDYCIYTSDNYFECLNLINNLAWNEYDKMTSFFVINDYGHYDYYKNINEALDIYISLRQKKISCVLGANIQLDDYPYYLNKCVDLFLFKASADNNADIYFHKVEDSPFFRANPKIVNAISIAVQRIKPSQMINISKNMSFVEGFQNSFLMASASNAKVR